LLSPFFNSFYLFVYFIISVCRILSKTALNKKRLPIKKSNGSAVFKITLSVVLVILVILIVAVILIILVILVVTVVLIVAVVLVVLVVLVVAIVLVVLAVHNYTS